MGKERDRGSSGHKSNKNKSNKWCVREREIGGNRRYFLEWWWYLYIEVTQQRQKMNRMQSIVLNLSIVIALVLFVGETCILCAEITIPYNQYSASPTIGGPAMKEFFIQKAENYTASV